MPLFTRFPCAALALATGLFAGCASPPPAAVPAAPAREALYAVTARLELIRFSAARPEQVLDRKRLLGLPDGETLVGIDFRVGRATLYALSSAGRLYTIDTSSGILLRVGMAPSTLPLVGDAFGIDFNSATDRIRVVGASRQNLRMHPDTGSVIDGDTVQPGLQGDTALAYAAGDAQGAAAPQVVAAASTHDRGQDDSRVTHYGIDRLPGSLVVQGSLSGAVPAVSPDSGLLHTVGPLGLGRLVAAAFDIGEVDGAALAAVRTAQEPAATRLVRIDLATGSATVLGTVGTGEPLVGLAIEP